jgi:hypothetical protein
MMVIATALVASLAQAQDYQFVAADAAAAFLLPGANGLLGDGDDVERFDVGSVVSFDPNYLGGWSWVAYTVSGPPETGLPSPHNVAVFGIDGSLTVDETVATGGGGPLLTGGSLTLTGHRQGAGGQTVDFVATGGTYNPVTGELTLSFDVSVSASNVSVDLSGHGFVLDAPFQPIAGQTHLNTVLIPLANRLQATSLVYTELSGNSVVGASDPFQASFFAVRGIANQADLSIAATASPQSPAPGASAAYSLIASNDGPNTATGVAAYALLPDWAAWSSDTCGAGPPSGGVLQWDVGSLGSGASTTCSVAVTIDGGANSMIGAGAMVLSEVFDPDPWNNIDGAWADVHDIGATEGVDQQPNRATGFPSDLACDLCAGPRQIVAANFKVDGNGIVVDSLRFWGAYTAGAFADWFDIDIYHNTFFTPGLPPAPGSVVWSYSGPVSRSTTGQQVLGFTEFMYDLGSLSPPLELDRGTYWISIVNDSVGAGTSDWFWETGADDLQGRTVPYMGATTTLPGSEVFPWNLSDANEMAVRLVMSVGSDPAIFVDGFETANSGAWSRTVP